MITLAKLKAAGTWLLALAVAILAALNYRQKAAREKERRQATEAAREVERKATDAVIDGTKRIEEARHAPIDTRDRSGFERD